MAMAAPPVSRKIVLRYIEDDSDRKATFKKRKKSVLKKARELSVLCGVTVCAIVCSPFRELETEAYPDVGGVREAYARFKGMSEAEQARKKYSQEKITGERIEKVKGKLMKMAMANREKEMTEVMFQCLNGQQMSDTMGLVDLNDLAIVTQRHLQQITDKLKALGVEADSVLMPPPPPPPPPHYEGNNGDMLTPMFPDSHLNMLQVSNANVNTNNFDLNMVSNGMGLPNPNANVNTNNFDLNMVSNGMGLPNPNANVNTNNFDLNMVSNGMWVPNVNTNNGPEGPAAC